MYDTFESSLKVYCIKSEIFYWNKLIICIDNKENKSILHNENINFFFDGSSRNEWDTVKLKALNYLKMKRNVSSQLLF